MARFNFQKMCVECRIVYYGPGFCGKTTNLQVIHEKAPAGATGDLSSIATKDDRTLFFDFMPMDLGKVAGLDLKFLMYTVPGQVYYNNTRKLVLQSVDGIVFVADSDKQGVGKMKENLESFQNLLDNLKEQNRSIDDIPTVLQYNKRDLGEVYSIEELNEALNKKKWPIVEAVAVSGHGVFQTIKVLSRVIVEQLNNTTKEGLNRVVKDPTGNRDEMDVKLEEIKQASPPPASIKVVVPAGGMVNLQRQPPPPPAPYAPIPPVAPPVVPYPSPYPIPQPQHTSSMDTASAAQQAGISQDSLVHAIQALMAAGSLVSGHANAFAGAALPSSGGGAGLPSLLQLMQTKNFKPDEIIKAIQTAGSRKGFTSILEQLYMSSENFDTLMKTFGDAGGVKGFSTSKFISDYDNKKH
jgi:signal recognition particle receptor subunit beta